MTNTNNVKNALVNRYRDITITDKLTNETKEVYRAVNLKTSDFESRNEGMTYTRNLRTVAPFLANYAAVIDSGNEDARLEARKDALAMLQRLVDYLAHAGGFDTFTVQKKELNYVIRLAYVRKLDRVNKTGVTVEVKSKTALQSLIEDIVSYRLNGKKLPSVKLSDTMQAELDKQAIRDKEAAEKAAAATSAPSDAPAAAERAAKAAAEKTDKKRKSSTKKAA